MVKKLSVFINNLMLSNQLIIDIYHYINENRFSGITVKKSIQKGHHVEVETENSEVLLRIKAFVHTLMMSYKKEKIDELKLKRQIAEVSKMEGLKAHLEIIPDGEIRVEEKEEEQDKISPAYSPQLEAKVERLKMELVLYLEKSHFFEESQSRQNITLTKLYLNLGLLFKNDLTLGYLSMKSNILYFNSQLETLRPKLSEGIYQKYYSLVNTFDSEEEKFVNEAINLYLDENKSSYFKDFIDRVYKFFQAEFSRGNLYTGTLSQAKDFFIKNAYITELSDFHKTFFSNKNFVDQYATKNFISYKYTTDLLYQVMPLLNVNPLRKQKITKMVSDKVESGYRMTWKDSFDRMNHFFSTMED